MRVNENLVLRNIYEKSLLIPVRKSEAGIEPIFLNDMAVAIWKLAQEGLSKKDIVNSISFEYGLESGSIEENMIGIFIDKLLDKKIIYE